MYAIFVHVCRLILRPKGSLIGHSYFTTNCSTSLEKIGQLERVRSPLITSSRTFRSGLRILHTWILTIHKFLPCPAMGLTCPLSTSHDLVEQAILGHVRAAQSESREGWIWKQLMSFMMSWPAKPTSWGSWQSGRVWHSMMKALLVRLSFEHCVSYLS